MRFDLRLTPVRRVEDDAVDRVVGQRQSGRVAPTHVPRSRDTPVGEGSSRSRKCSKFVRAPSTIFACASVPITSAPTRPASTSTPPVPHIGSRIVAPGRAPATFATARASSGSMLPGWKKGLSVGARVPKSRTLSAASQPSAQTETRSPSASPVPSLSRGSSTPSSPSASSVLPKTRRAGGGRDPRDPPKSLGRPGFGRVRVPPFRCSRRSSRGRPSRVPRPIPPGRSRRPRGSRERSRGRRRPVRGGRSRGGCRRGRGRARGRLCVRRRVPVRFPTPVAALPASRAANASSSPPNSSRYTDDCRRASSMRLPFWRLTHGVLVRSSRTLHCGLEDEFCRKRASCYRGNRESPRPPQPIHSVASLLRSSLAHVRAAVRR